MLFCHICKKCVHSGKHGFRCYRSNFNQLFQNYETECLRHPVPTLPLPGDSRYTFTCANCRNPPEESIELLERSWYLDRNIPMTQYQ